MSVCADIASLRKIQVGKLCLKSKCPFVIKRIRQKWLQISRAGENGLKWPLGRINMDQNVQLWEMWEARGNNSLTESSEEIPKPKENDEPSLWVWEWSGERAEYVVLGPSLSVWCYQTPDLSRICQEVHLYNHKRVFFFSLLSGNEKKKFGAHFWQTENLMSIFKTWKNMGCSPTNYFKENLLLFKVFLPMQSKK